MKRKLFIWGLLFVIASVLIFSFVINGCSKGKPTVESKSENKIEDNRRDTYLESHGLRVLRFDSRQVLLETDAVVERIFQVINESLSQKNPPSPPFSKGGKAVLETESIASCGGSPGEGSVFPVLI